jgi:hypothetical protein
LQKKHRGLAEGVFEFRNTGNGTTVVAKEMSDFSAIKSLYPKSRKPTADIVGHLPFVASADGMYEELMELAFDVISDKGMYCNHR